MIWAGAAARRAEPLTLFVSPQGNDSWSGRIDAANRRANGRSPGHPLAKPATPCARMRKNGHARRPRHDPRPRRVLRAGRDAQVPARGRRDGRGARRLPGLSRRAADPSGRPADHRLRRASERPDPEGRPGRAGPEGRGIQGALLRRRAPAAGPLSQLRPGQSLRRRLGLRRRQARSHVRGSARRGSATRSTTRPRTGAPGASPARSRSSSSPATTGGTTSSRSSPSTRRPGRSGWPARPRTRSAPATATTSATPSRSWTRPASGISTERPTRSTSGLPRRSIDGNDVVAPVVGTLIAIEPETSYLTLRGFTLEACTGEAVVLDRDRRTARSPAARSGASATTTTGR